MSEARYKIVFSGEVIPGHDLNTVKDNLAMLFKADPTRIEALFKGSATDIKRDLSEAQAKQYFTALQKAGAQVKIEHDLSNSLTLVETEDHPAVNVAQSASRMTCPKCGHEQAQNSECSACGIIVDKYVARQAELVQSGSATPVSPATPYATPKSNLDTQGDVGTLNVFTTNGRIGRLRYLAWGAAINLIALPILTLLTLGIVAKSSICIILFTLAAIAFAVVMIMVGVQRLHDIGWSGWLMLISIVPGIGSAFPFLMLFIPGNAEVNRYGPPPPPNSTAVIVLSCVWIALIILLIMSAILVPSFLDTLTALSS